MEKEGLVRGLDFLEKSGLEVGVLVTDRHPQIQKYLREKKPNITHYYDVWHCAKSTYVSTDTLGFVLSSNHICNAVTH